MSGTYFRLRDMIVGVILAGLTSFILAGEPAVFDNYFDDSIKQVDISQESAIKACLQNGDGLASKVSTAYDKCFGTDYDFDDLAEKDGGPDGDSDGLSDTFEGNEACFYKEMGWVDDSGAVAKVIKADLEGLDAELKTEFDENIDKCAAWSGDFGLRRKREAGDDETNELIAAVPAVMETGSAALNWLRSAVRKTRSAEKGEGKGESKKSGKSKAKSGKSKGKKARSGKSKGSSGKYIGGKYVPGAGKKERSGKSKGKTGKSKGKKARSGKSKGSSGKYIGGKYVPGAGKKERSGKSKGKTGKYIGGKYVPGAKDKRKAEGNAPKLLDEETYNKLWCFDLSMEQVLEKCVENKIKN